MNKASRPPAYLPLLVWIIAECFYIVAVTNRTSLASLGPATQEHFGIQATALSSFAVLQLVVYAGMQIPVGLLLDRFGVTVVLMIGGTTMFLAQIVMAFTSEVWIAVVARMFLGAGDAGIFISVLRLLPDWFEARWLPLMGQLTGILGNVGQIISLMPLAFVVASIGWSPAFMGISAAGMLVALLGFFVVRDRPGTGTAFERLTGRSGRLTERSKTLFNDKPVGVDAMPDTTSAIGTLVANTKNNVFAKIRTLLKIPGIRLAFWVHFTTPFSMHMLLLLWGTPFLVGGMGVDPVVASSIMASTVVVAVVAALIFGRITARFASKRIYFIFVSVGFMVATWLTVILWPGKPSLVLVVVALYASTIGFPASMVSFEVARSYSPRRMMGIATGLVNMGGFIGGLVAIFVVGALLDLQGAGTPETYRLDAFKIAFTSQFLIWALGVIGLIVETVKTRRWVSEH